MGASVNAITRSCWPNHIMREWRACGLLSKTSHFVTAARRTPFLFLLCPDPAHKQPRSGHLGDEIRAYKRKRCVSNPPSVKDWALRAWRTTHTLRDWFPRKDAVISVTFFGIHSLIHKFLNNLCGQAVHITDIKKKGTYWTAVWPLTNYRNLYKDWCTHAQDYKRLRVLEREWQTSPCVSFPFFIFWSSPNSLTSRYFF